jgi:hypothetical protein
MTPGVLQSTMGAAWRLSMVLLPRLPSLLLSHPTPPAPFHCCCYADACSLQHNGGYLSNHEVAEVRWHVYVTTLLVALLDQPNSTQ